MWLRWFSSRTVRQASDLCHRVRKVANAQRDVLTPSALEAVDQAIAGVKNAISSGAGKDEILKQAADLENVARDHLRPYPAANIRENVDVILVALVVALGIRTFFLQPMAIPTGSMQPTLYGITHQDLRGAPDAQVPGRLSRIFQSLFLGTSYYEVKARAAGEFRGFGAPTTVLPFVKRQQFAVGSEVYTVWFPPDNLMERSGLIPGEKFQAGQDIIKLKVVSGDRLFVDRFTYNFRRPKRGEIVIFASEGIPMLAQDTHYIKRLVGLPDEVVQIGNDRHAIINGTRLTAATPHFENLYSFEGPPRDSHYSGHVNNYIGQMYGGRTMAPLFPDEKAEFKVRPDHYFVLGDNTMNSYDSRFWGDFPREKVVGRHWFVFWPFTSRFGWSVR